MADRHDADRHRRPPNPEGGDWRRGYGRYGASGSEPGIPRGGRGRSAGGDRFDERYYEELSAGYGLGGPGDEASRGQRGWDEWEWEPSGPSGWRGRGGRDPRERAGEEELPWTNIEPWAVPGPFTGRGPEGYTRSSDAIREDVCERLTRHGGLDASGIRVTVDANEVILEGTVASRAAKRMAEDAAETVSGVRDVHNRLRLRSQGRDGEGDGDREDDRADDR
jgi:hypothetical protein